MDAATKRILEGLEKAIRAEVEGHHFYMMAAKTIEDAKGREVFEKLAQDEVDHARFLQAQYDAVSATGKPDAALTLGEPTELEGPHPIFSEALRERIKTAHFEMTALAVGAQLELNAIEFYRAEATAAGDPVVIAFYRKLADWESSHYHALLTEQDALKQEYWTEGQFSPF